MDIDEIAISLIKGPTSQRGSNISLSNSNSIRDDNSNSLTNDILRDSASPSMGSVQSGKRVSSSKDECYRGEKDDNPTENISNNSEGSPIELKENKNCWPLPSPSACHQRSQKKHSVPYGHSSINPEIDQKNNGSVPVLISFSTYTQELPPTKAKQPPLLHRRQLSKQKSPPLLRLQLSESVTESEDTPDTLQPSLKDQSNVQTSEVEKKGREAMAAVVIVESPNEKPSILASTMVSCWRSKSLNHTDLKEYVELRNNVADQELNFIERSLEVGQEMIHRDPGSLSTSDDSRSSTDDFSPKTPLPTIKDYVLLSDQSNEVLMQIIRCFPFPSPKSSPILGEKHNRSIDKSAAGTSSKQSCTTTYNDQSINHCENRNQDQDLLSPLSPRIPPLTPGTDQFRLQQQSPWNFMRLMRQLHKSGHRDLSKPSTSAQQKAHSANPNASNDSLIGRGLHKLGRVASNATTYKRNRSKDAQTQKCLKSKIHSSPSTPTLVLGGAEKKSCSDASSTQIASGSRSTDEVNVPHTSEDPPKPIIIRRPTDLLFGGSSKPCGAKNGVRALFGTNCLSRLCQRLYQLRRNSLASSR